MFRPVTRVSKLVRFAPVRTVTNMTTKTSIYDHTTGKIISLTDPNRPELGDYPNPEPVLAQSKDPYAKYDDQQHRRNLNDPVNFDDDLYDMWSPDYFQPVSDATALKYNAVFFSLFFGFGAAIYYFELNPEKPAMPRSFPFNGLAKDLGSSDPKDDAFYQVKPDLEAEKELKFLPLDLETSASIEQYNAANAEFIKQ